MTSGGKRSGSGRKPTGRKKKPAAQVRLTPAQKAWLDAAAGRSQVSISVYLYALLLARGMPK